MAPPATGLHDLMNDTLRESIERIEELMERDTVSVYGPIIQGLDGVLRNAMESLAESKPQEKLAVVLDTPGGDAIVVERMVETIRHFYKDVAFVIPDRAMSAGTIFAMSGDHIFMDYFSRLGPIDPQVFREDRFVPALSYLHKYKELVKKSEQGTLTTAEYTLFSKFDLAELHGYEQARDLTITLLEKWLATYKFKNWHKTEGRGLEVNPKMQRERAGEIAASLNDTERWHMHGRGISREILEKELKLKIDPLEDTEGLPHVIRKFHLCVRDWMAQYNFPTYVRTRTFG